MFSKMDKNKCPKTKIQKNFPIDFFTLLYNKLKKILKELVSRFKKFGDYK